MCHQSRQLSAVIKDGFSALDRMQDWFFEVSKRPEVERFRLAFARRSGKAECILIEAEYGNCVRVVR